MAPLTERADAIFVEGRASTGHVVLGHVGLLGELLLAVCVRALGSPAAEAFHFPVFAHLSLLLLLVLLGAVELGVLFHINGVGGSRRIRMNFFVEVVTFRGECPLHRANWGLQVFHGHELRRRDEALHGAGRAERLGEELGRLKVVSRLESVGGHVHGHIFYD